MAFKSLDTVLQPDPRFIGLCIVENGMARQMTLADHHAGLVEIKLNSAVPVDVTAAFDRARNTIVYAFFDYDLFVVGEVQAFGALELALKFRMNGHGGSTRGTLRNLVDRARKAGVLPQTTPGNIRLNDPIEALVALRNGISHGNVDIHSLGMMVGIMEACAHWIDHVFPNPK
jgi:hypothetical protein